MTAASDLHVPGPVARYLSGLLAATRSSLHDDLEAIYVTGSIALGDFQPATSDVDLLVATRSTLPHGRLAELADGVAAVSIPARGLEYVVYPLAALRDPEPTPAWELNLNVGPRLAARHTGFDPSAEPRYWSVLDLALARQSGLPLVGPAASALIASIPREWLRSALKESLAWHEAEDRGSPNQVLNACRAWLWAEHGRLTSKTLAAEWAFARTGEAVIREALQVRATGVGAIDADAAARLVGRVEAILSAGA